MIKRKYLITGHLGFIGSHITESLKKLGHEVIGIDDCSGAKPDIFKVKTHVVSITDSVAVNDIFFTEKPTHVIHCAATAAENLSPFIRNYVYTTNVVGSANIINGCLNYGVEQIDFLSSVACYGHSNDIPFSEDQYPVPDDPYGVSKIAIESDLRIAHIQHHLNYRSFRCHNVIGTNQNRLDPFRNVVGIFISNLFYNNPLPIFGDGKQIRQFTPVEYIVKAVTSPEVPLNAVYNVGSDQECTILQLADTLLNIFWEDDDLATAVGHYCFLPSRHEAFHPKCNHTKVQQYVGPCPYDLNEELRKIIQWAKTDKGFHAKLPKAEVRRGLPESWQKYA